MSLALKVHGLASGPTGPPGQASLRLRLRPGTVAVLYLQALMLLYHVVEDGPELLISISQALELSVIF